MHLPGKMVLYDNHRTLKSGIRLIFLALGFHLAGYFATPLGAEPPPDYYAAAAALSGGPLKQALHEIVSVHIVIPYGSILNPLRDIWRDPANPANILLTYSGTSVAANSGWNREHLWPRSRGNSDQAGPDDSDLFHVVPTDVSVNAERGSLYYDDSDPADPSYRIPAISSAPQTSRDSNSWQPSPAERGDIARALFYMDVVYDGQEMQTTDMELVSFPPTASQMGLLNTLLLWNEQDPPDAAERARNDLIYTTYQRNRNPFIDHPEWATAIWGSGVSTGVGNRPIARVSVMADSAVEATQTSAIFQVSLNQFAGAGGVTVTFSMTGTAGLTEYALSGDGVTYDSTTGAGSVFIPANFANVQVRLVPVNDGAAEPVETAVVTLNAAEAYSVVPDTSSVATLLISDAPRLPLAWNFNNAPFSNPLPANAGVGSISFSGWLGTINTFSGSSGNALALVGNSGNGSWIDIHLSMTGYTSLALGFWTRGTSGGYNSGTWSASVDGVNFSTLEGVNTATRSTIFSQAQVGFSSLPALTNAPSVTLRYTLNGATTSSGNNRIDELAVTATPFPSGNGLRTVSLAAADATASDITMDTGAFAVQLNGLAPAGGLEVLISFGNGTATSPGSLGADYTLSGLASYDNTTRIGRLIFTEGQSTALITVTPLADTLVEGSETVIASVVASASYLSGANNQAIVTIFEPLPNDSFSEAIALTGIQATVTGSNVGATRETGEPNLGSTNGRTVWWRWTAPANGAIKVHTRGSSFDTYLGIYNGASVNSLTTVGINDDGGGNLTSLLSLPVISGNTYYIAVDGFSSSTGQIVLSLDFSPLPSVGISAINTLAKERGNVTGKVRFTLAKSYPLPVGIAVSLGGGATVGVDYLTLPSGFSMVVIPAEALTTDLEFLPLSDSNLIEGMETISVVVGNSPNYTVDPAPQNGVMLTIEDDSPYSMAWISANAGVTPENTALAGDADHDGIPTLLEYIANRDPRISDGTALLKMSQEIFNHPADGSGKTFAALRFVRRLDAAGIPLVLEVSQTLAANTWQVGGVFLSATMHEDGVTEELLYRSVIPSTEAPNLFFRLRATWP